MLSTNNTAHFDMYKSIKKIVFESKNKVILSRMYLVRYLLMCFCSFKERCIRHGDFLENYISITNSSDTNLNNIVWQSIVRFRISQIVVVYKNRKRLVA